MTDPPGYDPRYAIDPTRISRGLGWQQRHSFEEGLAATVRWDLGHHSLCGAERDRADYAADQMVVLAVGGAS